MIVPGESTVAYRVGETLLAQAARWRAVVGVTNALGGEIFINRTNPGASRAGTITVDMTRLKSDSDRRDSALRARWLETAKFPTAEFTLGEIRGMPRVFTEGREVAVQLVGTLRIRDVARPASFAAILSLEGVTLRGVAGTTVRMTDFGIQPPSLLGAPTRKTTWRSKSGSQRSGAIDGARRRILPPPRRYLLVILRIP